MFLLLAVSGIVVYFALQCIAHLLGVQARRRHDQG